MDRRALFPTRLLRDPEVARWLDSLTDDEVDTLKDDLTPLYKELAYAAVDLARLQAATGSPQPVTYGELTGAAADELRATIVEAAAEVLPAWQLEAFRQWIAGAPVARIAQATGASRATVRAALEGEGGTTSEAAQPGLFGGVEVSPSLAHRAGAIKAMAVALAKDEGFTKMARKKIDDDKADNPPRSLWWYRGIARKPELFAAMALLQVLDDMADARGEVAIADLWSVVPRQIITPLLVQLKAHGYAASDGRKIRIHTKPQGATR